MAYTRQPNKTFAGRALSQTPGPVPKAPAGELPVTINANIASKFGLGVVQVGDNISITPDGIISVTAPSGNCACTAKTIDSDYSITDQDYYIGVNSDGPVTLTLPENPTSCAKFIIKIQMRAPLGSRKVTVVPQGSALIDGVSFYTMTVPYEAVTVLYNDGHWWIV